MSTSVFPPPFKIVVALDASEYAEIVLEHALDQAARHDVPELHFLVVAERQNDSAEIERLRTWLTATVIEGLSTFAGKLETSRTRVHIRDGRPEEEIVNLAAELQANLLVIGRYGGHRWRKSLTDRIVDMAPCPTLVVGLTERGVEEHEQCPDCVEVRADSDGERWFCDAHSDNGRLRWSSLVDTGSPSLLGGAML